MAGEMILWFDSISKEDIGRVGGKGANLGEMHGLMPVPNGFSVTVEAYELFIEKAGIGKKIHSLLAGLDYDDTSLVEKKASEIRALIQSGKMPAPLSSAIASAYKKLGGGYVAVRSSATAEDLPNASFAGQQDTYLNIKGDASVIDAVKRCFASLFTARAVVYRHSNGFSHELVKISVVVQEMVDSEKAGVIFTANPVNKRRDEMIIEGSYGLGESVVSGQVTPDTYIIQKSPFLVKETSIGSKSTEIIRDKQGKNITRDVGEERSSLQLLTGKELKELSALAMKIEEHYGKPQDIEWAISKGKYYILQSRPITTL